MPSTRPAKRLLSRKASAWVMALKSTRPMDEALWLYFADADLCKRLWSRGWRIAYTSTSLAGAQAAVRAGLGVAVLPKEMVPADFVVLDSAAGAPDLLDTEIALILATPTPPAAARLAQHVVHALELPSRQQML